MEFGAILAWALAHEAVLATIVLVVSELLGAIPAFKSNGILSFLILQVKSFAFKRGGVSPTSKN